MPGFVNRDAQGREIFRFDQSIVRLLGSLTINAGTTTGYLDIPDSATGSPFYFYQPPNNPQNSSNGYRVILEGRRISWNNIEAGTVIRFGVF
ncbi:hypothetical protein [Pseudomonas oryzihabitans]|uniref:Uncharacterized protein n=1 Tax=Pseudomonas oryzihabitans TaxID=47885 RepID=A0ABX3IQP2_9PSED|nr:hypothetical protein [Pseudomonas psychrotolerans]ONN70643.1 hypothetical protein BVL52_20625 [Pseudomonas psychrotolerans]